MVPVKGEVDNSSYGEEEQTDSMRFVKNFDGDVIDRSFIDVGKTVSAVRRWKVLVSIFLADLGACVVMNTVVLGLRVICHVSFVCLAPCSLAPITSPARSVLG